MNSTPFNNVLLNLYVFSVYVVIVFTMKSYYNCFINTSHYQYNACQNSVKFLGKYFVEMSSKNSTKPFVVGFIPLFSKLINKLLNEIH